MNQHKKNLVAITFLVFALFGLNACGGGASGNVPQVSGGGGAVDTIAPTVAATPSGGTYGPGQLVQLLASEVAVIYYTTDGSVPTKSSAVYSAPIALTDTTTIRYFAVDTAGNPSAPETELYTIDASLPSVTASPVGGVFQGTTFVSLASSKPGTIYYTLDGSEPTESSRIYYSPITIQPNASTALKFFSVDRIGSKGPVSTQVYTTGQVVATLVMEGLGSQSNVPFTVGQVFHEGHVLPTDGLIGELSDGTSVPLQVDFKATHGDGSVRHAVLSGVLPAVAASSSQTLSIKKTFPPAATSAASPLAKLGAHSLTVNVTDGGVAYVASLSEALGGSNVYWLRGPVAHEWVAAMPLQSAADGTGHPHLAARFSFRAYSTGSIKVDLTVENAWAYEPSPRGYTYDVGVAVDGVVGYAKSALTHYPRTRWMKTFWIGVEPALHVKHHTGYLIGSKAVPNYDQTVNVTESVIASLKSKFDVSNNGPLGNGIAVSDQGTTGGRIEIGLIPGWGSMYLLSMDRRAKLITTEMGKLGGSWGTHYRDKTTGRPLTVGDYPYVSNRGTSGETINPATGKTEALPACTATCSNPRVIGDSAHEPAFAYLSYLVTGDYFYLEELIFQSMWNIINMPVSYRQQAKGLVYREQVRGMAWILRDLADAAYLLPDDDPAKSHLLSMLQANLEDLNGRYITSSATAPNAFGAITTGEAFPPYGGLHLAPWQQDFVSSSLGIAWERKLSPLADAVLRWKSTFPVGRMTAPGFCWVFGSRYTLKLRDTTTGPLYTTFAQVYQATVSPEIYATECSSVAMVAAIAAPVPPPDDRPSKAGSMMGYPRSALGYPSNMQPALAFAVDAGLSNAGAAWQIFDNRTEKPVSPPYSEHSQFAIVPR